MGSYLEEGYPLYTINDTMLNILGYTYEELVDATNEKMMKYHLSTGSEMGGREHREAVS